MEYREKFGHKESDRYCPNCGSKLRAARVRTINFDPETGKELGGTWWYWECSRKLLGFIPWTCDVDGGGL